MIVFLGTYFAPHALAGMISDVNTNNMLKTFNIIAPNTFLVVQTIDIQTPAQIEARSWFNLKTRF